METRGKSFEVERFDAHSNRLNLLSAGPEPLYYKAILKVGCTYIKILMYYLEHGKIFDDPIGIHQENVMTSVALSRDELLQGIAFIVVRDPIERFFSLYFDKAYGKGPQAFPWIADRLTASRKFDNSPDISLEQHRENCVSFLGWIRFKFKTQNWHAINPHWAPQALIANRVLPFDLNFLLLENLEQQLLQICDGRIEGLEDAMSKVRQRNKSKKPFQGDQILTPEIEKRIRQLYPDDFALYEHVKQGWADTGKPPNMQDYHG